MSRSRGAKARASSRPLCTLVALLVLLLAAPVTAQTRGSGGAIRIQVRGGAQISAAATVEPSGTIVRGELLDDAGAAVAGATISLRAIAEGGAAVNLPTPSTCDATARRSRRSVRLVGTDAYEVQTDDRGAFCVRAGAAIGQASIKLRFDGDELRDPAESVVRLDAADAPLARTILRFEPAPDVIDLDRETVLLTGSLRVDRTGSSRSNAARREGLAIRVEDERGERIAEGQTGGDGRVRFEIPSASFPGPGSGELRLRFEGTTTLAKATTTQPIVRRAEVRLALAHPVDAGDPEDGVGIDVDVTTSRGPVTGGVVEALRGSESVGAGTVQGGKAHVIASFALERAGVVPLTLRYVPAAPFYKSGANLQVDVNVKGPGIARQILIAIVVLAVTAWIVFGWRRAPMPPKKDEDDEAHPVPSGRAGVEVVRASTGQGGYRGAVLDAHDGTPIAGARLAVVAPAFQGDGVVARATADERGTFVLDVPYRSDARLVIEAEEHSRYEQTLPPPGVLRVALITRRRTLLERLVKWARRTGAPFDMQPEPTPGHVRRAAFRANNAEIESWARALEQAAYGPSVVDEGVEASLLNDEPRGGRKPAA
ncbi:carboxypeptidase regulatory-like domain-containing protein [Polyangium mundeleinium]|uniref:Carboxypeptidase regulatory-like domain-containing protein n=1 Tax=Polyangium mundeleinium TaxID=2995306 RepID=A0ABT5ERK9_9BACT|nr:carboxypeptidase regulatory-like domain-containing protein [Polyangium mundeleinium]MDC0743395.1 carboxypeptidase regulatory-like domain-containing protein [Polyangium mundeleinium]